MSKMLVADWMEIKHFSTSENWGDPFLMDHKLIYGLDDLRAYVGNPIHIHCGYEKRTTGGWHPHGKAADIHIEGLHVIDQFLVASRFDVFNGIGVYGPDVWNNPGLHLDTRPPSQKYMNDARWGQRLIGQTGESTKVKKIYVPLNKEFLLYLESIT